MTAYYNEFEPYAAEWLRNLIKKGLIADGIVDDRSIASVEASDLGDFTQCHFFAGIGVWSYALRLAGWPDDRPVWTGSCPCQPFSAAGKGKGVEDERHLWPEFDRLITECRPPVVFGEQVASKDGLVWLDAVCADMERAGYAIGALDLCAAGIGAPHIRQRLWFVGERLDDAAGARREEARAGEPDERQRWSSGPELGRGPYRLADADEQQRNGSGSGNTRPARRRELADDGSAGGLGDHHHQGLEGQRSGHQAEVGWLGAVRSITEAGEPRGLADAEHDDRRPNEQGRRPEGRALDGRRGSARGLADAMPAGRPEGWTGAGNGQASRHDSDCRPGPTNGHWRAADWLHCRDGKWRPVEPGTFPLVDGAPARVGRLRAYGNAIVPQAAAEVISAFMGCRP